MADQRAVDLISAYAAEIGRRGGKARLTKMSAEERSRVAKRAAQARWGRKLVAPDPTPPPDPKGPQRDEQWAEAGIMSTPRPVASVTSVENSKPRSRALAA